MDETRQPLLEANRGLKSRAQFGTQHAVEAHGKPRRLDVAGGLRYERIPARICSGAFARSAHDTFTTLDEPGRDEPNA